MSTTLKKVILSSMAVFALVISFSALAPSAKACDGWRGNYIGHRSCCQNTLRIHWNNWNNWGNWNHWNNCGGCGMFNNWY